MLTLFLLFQINRASAAPAPDWYNTSWNYRRAITIDNTGDGLFDYQVKIELTTGNFDYSKASSTGADIRFTDEDGTTLIDYWIEEWNDTATSTTWVEVPDISASSTKTIYMYYGNAEVISASNGDNTFRLFDDFDDRWLVDVGNPGEHPIIHNSKVYMPADGLYILDLNTGEVLHHYLSGDWYYAAPVIDNSGFIHIYSGDTGYIQKVNENTGPVASINIGKRDFESLTYDSVNDRLIVMATGGLKAINTSDYTVQWTNTDINVARAQSACPLIVGDYVYARSNSNGLLYKINLNIGATEDSVALAGNGARYATLVYDSDHEYIYAFEHSECNVYARRADNLAEVWTTNLGDKSVWEIMYTGMYHANRLIVPVREEAWPYGANLYALDVTDNGNILWTNTTAYDNGANLTNGAIDDDYIYIPTHDYVDGSYHKLLVINVSDGTLHTSHPTYEQNSNSACSSLVASGGKVVLGLWDTEQAQMISIRSGGDNPDTTLYKIDQYRTGYLGTRLSGSFLDDLNTGWTNPGNFNIQNGTLKKDVAYTNPSRYWQGIAMSSDGAHQTAVVYGGQIYVSTNYGNTWTQKDSDRDWTGIAMSGDGQYQTAVASDDYIYVSTNYGETWALNENSPTADWVGIAMSSDGQYQTAVVDEGYIYVSTNYGNTWYQKGTYQSLWSGIAMSSDGQYQTAVVNEGYVYVSPDYGSNWYQKGTSQFWSGIAMSSDGVHQTAVVYGGQIYVSSDSGDTWAPKDENRTWYGIAMSSDGVHQTAVVCGGQIYVSSDSGETWAKTGDSHDYLFTSTDTFAYPLAVEAKTKVGSDWSSEYGWNFGLSWDSDWTTTGYFSGHYKDDSSDYSSLKKFSSGFQTDSDEANESISTDTWYHLSLLVGSSAQYYNVDGTQKATLTTSPPTEDPTNIVLSTSRSALSGGYTTYFDWVFARNYTSPEPSTSVGSEESLYPIGNPGMHRILHQWWTGITGTTVSSLTSDPNYPDNPSGSQLLTSFEGPTNWADNYGTRISGYLHPPADGNYKFWIASDNDSELWLSTDSDPNHATKIAYVLSGDTNPREWDKYPSQQSAEIPLAAGQKYYIEALHKEGTDSDNLAVAWEGPGISQQVIDGNYLSSWWVGLYGDFTDNNIVDMEDFSEFLEYWLEDNCNETAGLDLDGNCIINFYEFSALAKNWQEP